jgi:iron complex transport system substrate-binding protein
MKPLFYLVLALLLWVSHASAEPQRIVSVGGALTEIVFDLGAGAELVGVDTTSVWPEAARTLPSVGYQRTLSSEGVISLAPGYVLVTEDAGPPAVLDQLRSAGVQVVEILQPPNFDGVVGRIRAVAAALDRAEQGEMLVARVQERINQLPETWSYRPKVVFLLDVGRGSPVAAGRDTLAHAALQLAGGINVYASSFAGYRSVSAESLMAAEPDVIVLTQRTQNLLGGRQGVKNLPGIRNTPAGEQGRIIAMDGLYLLGFGPRTPQAIQELARRWSPADSPAVRSSLEDH